MIIYNTLNRRNNPNRKITVIKDHPRQTSMLVWYRVEMRPALMHYSDHGHWLFLK